MGDLESVWATTSPGSVPVRKWALRPEKEWGRMAVSMAVL